LIELLVAVMIMGVAVVALVGGLGTSIRISDIHRKQAAAGAYVRAYAEAIENTISASPSAYVACADAGTYASAFAIADPTYAAQITAVKYWSGTGFADTCTVATDSGVQRVSLSVASSDGSANETLDVIVRKPCRPVSYFPLDPPCA
jgi:type II secretory pathway pseudopilin PulG